MPAAYRDSDTHTDVLSLCFGHFMHFIRPYLLFEDIQLKCPSVSHSFSDDLTQSMNGVRDETWTGGISVFVRTWLSLLLNLCVGLI